jgi:phospholipid transport system transporter-binding protein
LSGVRISPAGKAAWRLDGALDFTSVAEVWPQIEDRLEPGGQVKLSLAGVDRTNSAGLVMLIEALDVAAQRDCRLQLADLPAELVDLARMSGCDSMLGLEPG